MSEDELERDAQLPYADRVDHHGSRRLDETIQIEREALPVRQRDRLELSFALPMGYAELLVRVACLVVEPVRVDRAETFAFALCVVFEIELREFPIHYLRQRVRRRPGAGVRL